MSVSVRLLDLVSVPGTRFMWPGDFDSLIKAIEAKPSDRTAFGACADWLEEDDRNERELARAFRYLFGRPRIEVTRPNGTWVLRGLPATLLSNHDNPVDLETVAGSAADLYYRLEEAEKTLAKAKEDLT